MRFDAISVLGLAFQSAKVVKTKYNRSTYVFCSCFSERYNYILIHNLAYTGRCDNFRVQRLYKSVRCLFYCYYHILFAF